MIKKISYMFILFLALPKMTFAYIDPGTGSYIIQLIAGIVFAGGAGLMFWGKSLMKKIRHPFKKDNVEAIEETAATSNEEKKDEKDA